MKELEKMAIRSKIERSYEFQKGNDSSVFKNLLGNGTSAYDFSNSINYVCESDNLTANNGIKANNNPKLNAP